MGKIKACGVTFKQGQEVFRDGERVVGVVVLEVTDPVVVRGVRVFCCGQALTKWSKEFSRDWNACQVSTEQYFAQVCTLFGRKQNQDGPNQTLTGGRHRWSFAFRLPRDRLPSSFEGQHGAIRWFLKVEVDKPFPSINNTWFKPFTVLCHLDINEPVYLTPCKKEVSKTVSKALGLGNAGVITLSARTDHFGYCPGEVISLNVEAINESSKDMGKISINLVQSVVFTANDETKSTSLGVAGLHTELSLAKGTTMTLADIRLRVPVVPPSTRKRTCHIISCTYSVKVSVQVPWGLDLETSIPVAIGTVPRGHRLPSVRASQPQGASSAIPGVSTIQYGKCETGVIVCSKSHDTFPNLSYIPCSALHTPAPTGTPTTPTTRTSQGASAASYHQQGAMCAGKASTVTQVPAGVSAVAPVPIGMFGALGPPHLPPYTPQSAPPLEMEPPPAYEDIMRVEVESERAAEQQTTTTTTAAAAAATNMAVKPEGRKCVMVLTRFPDSSLASFRQTIRQEQNNLTDSDQAFLAALTPHPLTGLENAQDDWPEHTALALLVFPDADQAQEWLETVEERGDAWYPHCDMLMLPASCSLPPPGGNDRSLFSVFVGKIREGVDKPRFTSLVKTSAPMFFKLRQKHGGVRQALSKAATMLRGNWASNDNSVGVIWWPGLTSYMAYFAEKATGEFAKQEEALRTFWESQSVLLLSEDLTSLSTQPATSLDDDVTAGDDDVINNADDFEEESNADEENESVENVLDGEEE